MYKGMIAVPHSVDYIHLDSISRLTYLVNIRIVLIRLNSSLISIVMEVSISRV